MKLEALRRQFRGAECAKVPKDTDGRGRGWARGGDLFIVEGRDFVRLPSYSSLEVPLAAFRAMLRDGSDEVRSGIARLARDAGWSSERPVISETQLQGPQQIAFHLLLESRSGVVRAIGRMRLRRRDATWIVRFQIPPFEYMDSKDCRALAWEGVAPHLEAMAMARRGWPKGARVRYLNKTRDGRVRFRIAERSGDSYKHETGFSMFWDVAPTNQLEHIPICPSARLVLSQATIRHDGAWIRGGSETERA